MTTLTIRHPIIYHGIRYIAGDKIEIEPSEEKMMSQFGTITKIGEVKTNLPPVENPRTAAKKSTAKRENKKQ